MKDVKRKTVVNGCCMWCLIHYIFSIISIISIYLCLHVRAGSNYRRQLKTLEPLKPLIEAVKCDSSSHPEMEITKHFFEGVEKLLEIWFAADDSNRQSDLRSIPLLIWQNLLKVVKCEIISSTQNDEVDAYVLSESSMFVSKRRWILKTCGTTTPLACLKPLLQLAEQIGYHEVSDVFYSRKNFTRPELQLFPHRGFCEEVEFLDTIFEEGRSYCLGSLNHECWYLYTLSQPRRNGLINNSPRKLTRQIHLASSYTEPDQTIEILMQNLDPQIMDIFTKKCSNSAREATVKSRIDEILPDMKIDDFLFEPCGYSMNGINQHGEYMTIHITPESQFSYVSFESNVSRSNYADLIKNVIKTFLPSKFIITIFANKSSEAYDTMRELEYNKMSEWRRSNMQCCNFPSYNLLFAQYSIARDAAITKNRRNCDANNDGNS